MSSLLLVPSFLYVAWIGMSGGARDLWSQLTVYQGPSAFHVGVRMSNVWTALGLVAGAAATGPRGGTAIAGIAAFWVLAMYLTGESGRMAYVIFGLGVSVAAHLDHRTARFCLAAGWVASLSVGYPFPALASGPVLLMAAHAETSPSSALVAAAAVAGLAFIPLRRRHVYRQPPAKALRFDLSGILGGGQGIRTSETTRDALADLEAVVGRLPRALKYAVIPDLPGRLGEKFAAKSDLV